jgi:hypothetical protein
MISTFNLNMKRFNSLSLQLEKHGLGAYCGVVIDKEMPEMSHNVVCNHSELIVSENNFLEANPVIARHLEERQSNIDKFKVGQAEAHAWSNRPVLMPA